VPRAPAPAHAPAPPSGADATGESTGELAPDRSRRRVGLAFILAVGTGMLITGLTSAEPALAIPLAIVGFLLAITAFRMLTPAGTLTLARGLPTAILLRGALTFAYLGADAFVPLAFQGWRGISAEATSVIITIATLAWTAGSWLQTRGIERLGAAWFVRLALIMVTIGLVGTTALLDPDIPIAVGAFGFAFASLGIGFGYSALTLIALREAPPGREGASSSALQLSDVLGTVLGTGIGGAFIAAGARAGAEAWVGLAGAFGIAMVVGVLASLASWRLWPSRGAARTATAAPEAA
jgi:hypothetical protein